MQDAEVLRSRTHTSRKQGTKYEGFLPQEKKGFGIHQRNNRQKSEFLLISIILKNVYRLKDLFKDFLKLDRQENIF